MEVQQTPSKFVGYLLTFIAIFDCFAVCLASWLNPMEWYITWLMLIVLGPASYVFLASRLPVFSSSLKKPIVAFFVGFLPFILMIIFKVLFAESLALPLGDFIAFIPIALLIGGSGFFYFKATDGKKYLNVGIGVLCTLVAISSFLLFGLSF